MKDKLIRGITQDKFVRFFGIDSTETLKYATKIHNLSITNTVAYGRLLNAAAMMGMDLKSEDDLIVTMIGIGKESEVGAAGFLSRMVSKISTNTTKLIINTFINTFI